jgi:hypothetical protein
MEPQSAKHAYHKDGTGYGTPDKIGHLTDL